MARARVVVRRRNKRGRLVSVKKATIARNSKPLSAWIRACKAHGYLKKGCFKPMPRRGTSAHAAISKTYKNMLAGRSGRSGRSSPQRKGILSWLI